MKKHKDPNYIIQVENAIIEKYGEEAVQHPQRYWDEEKEKQYLEQIKLLSQKVRTNLEKSEKIEIEGFLISKKLLNKDSNRVCQVCDVYSFSGQDDVYMNKYDCCFKCYVQWVENREERWKTGWRPKKGENK